MSEVGTDTNARRCALAIRTHFGGFLDRFREITRRAREHFELRRWHDTQRDARSRLQIYTDQIALAVEALERLKAHPVPEHWTRIRQEYSRLNSADPNFELAQTFYNSITRRVFSTVGVNPDVEYLSMQSAITDRRTDPSIYTRRPYDGDSRQMVRAILEEFRFHTPYEDLERDVELAAARLDEILAVHPASPRIDAVEMLHPVLYRNKGAYIVGRMLTGTDVIPLLLPLLNTDRGIRVDAVLTNPDEASVVFSFARSYFLVDVECPREVVVFLKTIMPLKPVEELYISLGFHRHGKTELYRGLQRHLRNSNDRFRTAEGDAGMVMLVFALSAFDVVFKVIRDRFAFPKESSRAQIMDRYRLVFKHDRVGRLVDAQEFEHLEFSRRQFSSELLDELLAEASRTVTLVRDRVVVRHLYTERKLTPLNLYLRRVSPDRAQEAIIDYGNAIKELAAANIFPGDFLLKNFGVTRHRRVVFYDYDELCPLGDCRFREIPPARTDEEELASEPWYAIADNDVFPEEFERFLGLPPWLREIFIEQHGDLFTARFWRGLQERHSAGEILDCTPYPAERRLSRSGGPG